MSQFKIPSDYQNIPLSSHTQSNQNTSNKTNEFPNRTHPEFNANLSNNLIPIVDAEFDTVNEDDADPYVLLNEGRECLRQKKYNEAVNILSNAIETKLEDPLYSTNEVHANLAPFYFEYGHALLLRAENSQQIFSFWHGSSPKIYDQTNTDSIEKTNPNVENIEAKSDTSDYEVDVPDEQLTWEILELARMCYNLYLMDLENDKIIPFQKHNIHTISPEYINAVRDASLVHLYLASILLAEKQYVMAIEEVKKGSALLDQYNMLPSYKIPLLILLGDSYQANKQHNEALQIYKDSLDILTDQISSPDNQFCSPEDKEDLKVQRENVLLEIQELERNIEKGIFWKPNQHIHDLLLSLTINPSLLHMGLGVEKSVTNAVPPYPSPNENHQNKDNIESSPLPFHDYGVLKGRKKVTQENTSKNDPTTKRIKVASDHQPSSFN